MDGTKIIKPGAGPEPAAEPKLVKKDQVSAMLDAVTILDAAREQARAILRDAEDRREQTIETARRTGEEQGLARYQQALLDAHAAIDDFYTRAEPELVRLAGGIARKIVGEELRASKDTILQIVREALASGRRARQITVKVSPSDAAHLKANLSRLELGLSTEIEVMASESVQPGGCVVESEFGIVDAQLETQLRVIERALLRSGRPQ